MRWACLVLAGCGFQAGTTSSDGNIGVAIDARGDGHVSASIDAHADAHTVAPPDAEIAITYVQKGSAQTNSSLASLASTTYSDAQVAGDLDVVALAWLDVDTTVTVSDSAGNTYAALGSAHAGDLSEAVFYAPDISAAVGGANTVTATFTDYVEYPTIRIVEYGGLAATAPEAKMSASGDGSAAADSITTTHRHDLIYAAETSDSNATGAGSSFTDRMIYKGDLIEDDDVTSAGMVTATAPLDSTVTWIMIMGAFEGAS